jgi:rhodanese-related sulfurtransferase/DNA-binding transcriptional ArsR family regulator
MQTIRAQKDKLFEQFARIGQALSATKRLELIELLSQCEKDVDTLATHSGMSVANTSRHLQILRQVGLVEARRDGLHIIYSLAGPEVSSLYRNLRHVAEGHIAEVEKIMSQLYREADALEPVDRAHLLKMAKAGKITILDVRPEDEYEAAHLPHAISVPLPKLKDYMRKLPHSQEIVAYCRGPYCVLASEAIKLLRERGFKTRWLGLGVQEWDDAGLPLVSTN